MPTDEPVLNRRKLLSLGTAAAAGLMAAACDSMGPSAARGLLQFAMTRNEAVERWLFRRGSRDRALRGARDAGKSLPTYFVSERLPMWDDSLRGTWSLEVTGAVRHPMRLTLDDLMKLRHRTQRVNHYCVEGWTAVATWTGVRISELARIAQLTPDAHYVDFESFDSGYHESWDLDSALHPQTLVAYAMDGRFLNANHGAPARIHSPIKLGYKSVKYLTRIVFSPVKNGGYWTDRGYEWHAGV
ncbi:MAG TPA: molybdopterin-dependent oxidoreductase [Longimicrobiales bacterium]|nr:molybdopterin-dependent oxidoreductase [Longimicrobiales bacterium]